MGIDDTPEKKGRWLRFIVAALVLLAGLAVLFDFFPEEEKELRQGFRNAVEKAFPEQAARLADSFGMTCSREGANRSTEADPKMPSVVLIHGLDDPGKIWMNLAPALAANNMDVCMMNYPNDQPIADSASLFYAEASRLRELGIREIFIVAHSMGGLVSREMLTNPKIAFIEGARAEVVPRVVGLIMVGTPNHGSEMARFRVFSEIRDQWTSMLSGRGHVLRGILDGAGEAKIDLLPESLFLKTLNKRPHPEGVKMHIIAGVVSPWKGSDIKQLLDSAREKTPAAQQQLLVDLGAFLQSMSDGLGDGLVTVDSTRLEGIEHRTVAGTHLSMIRNISGDSGRVPPAVPVILGYLGQTSPRTAD